MTGMTRADVAEMIVRIQAIDGHPRKPADVDVWLDAATLNRWSVVEAVSALRKVSATFTGFRLMPGHVDEVVRADRRQPARGLPSAERLAIEGPQPAADDDRAEHIAKIVSMIGRKRSIPRADAPLTPEQRSADEDSREAKRERLRAMWAAVDACSLCNAQGMVQHDRFEVRCDHVDRGADSG